MEILVFYECMFYLAGRQVILKPCPHWETKSRNICGFCFWIVSKQSRNNPETKSKNVSGLFRNNPETKSRNVSGLFRNNPETRSPYLKTEEMFLDFVSKQSRNISGFCFWIVSKQSRNKIHKCFWILFPSVD